MYRIRLASGEQAVYKTVEELAAAVASGVISPTAEVFHKAGNCWLPINTHPDYRAVVTDKRPALPEIPNTPEPENLPKRHTAMTRKLDSARELDKLDLMQPEEVPEPAPILVKSSPVTVAPEFNTPAAAPAVVPDLVAQSELEDQPVLVPELSRPGRPTGLIVATVAGLVILAAVAAVVVTRAPRREPAQASALPVDSLAALVMPPADSISAPPAPRPGQIVKKPPITPAGTAATSPPRTAPARADTSATTYVSPSKPLAPVRPGGRSPVASQPPPRITSRLGTSVNRMPSYYEAYADARAEMDESLAYVDFRRVFAPGRFSSPDSIRAARRMVAAAGNILRVYRGKEVMLEQTYRAGESDGKGSLREPFEVAEASRGLLADVDSLYALLVSQEGEVRYRDESLQFQSPRAAQAYNLVRRDILQTLTYLGDPAEAADRVTMPRLLRGFGTDRPPPAR